MAWFWFGDTQMKTALLYQPNNDLVLPEWDSMTSIGWDATIVDKIPWDTCEIALISCVFKTEF